MNHFTESGHNQIEPGSQPRPEIPSNPTIQQMEGWDEKKLLQWIQQREPAPLKDENLDNFIAAGISGPTFLRHAGDLNFFMKAGVAIGPSDVLASLANEVKERGNLWNQTAGTKRKMDSEQAGLAEAFDAASKRRHPDSEIDAELLELAKRARERRDRIREKITTLSQLSDNADQLSDNADQLSDNADQLSDNADQLSDNADQLSNAADQLSNPAFHDILPFPFVGPPPPTRFKVDSDSDPEQNWFYTGREMFAEILQHVRNRSTLWVYGTKGYGKSHLLAALVCYLAAQGEPVVYIPDCRECMKDPVTYVQAAMLFAWADNETMQNEIITLDTRDMIRHFFKRHPNAIFFIDQLNGCEEMEWEGDQARSRKGQVKVWLDGCRAWRTTVLSTSANYKSYLETAQQENNNEITIYAYGGFTKTEMEQWWERNKDVTEGDVVRGGYTKKDVEDFTGKIPLLLDNSVVKDEKGQPFAIDLGTKFFYDIYEQALTYEQQIRSKCKDNWMDLEMHNTYMKACLSSRAVSPSSRRIPKLVDHRFFFDKYHKDQHAHMASSACGIARNAVATELLANRVNLSDRDFWSSLPDQINNPCTTGFIIEQAILSRISFSGLNIAGKDINTSMSVVLFSDNFPTFRTDLTEGPTLYCPQRFNYRAIDGIIIRIGPQPMTKEKKRQLFMYPLQITLALDKHSDSHKTFFNDYGTWTYGLEGYDVVPTFLWISPEVASPKLHTSTDEDIWPTHYEEYVPISQVNSNLWQLYMQAKQRQQIQRAPEPPAHGDGQGGIEKQMRLDGPSAAAGPSGGEASGSEASGSEASGSEASGSGGSGRRGSRSRGRGGIRSDNRLFYEGKKVAELKVELKARVLSCTGKKADLINRLIKDDKTKGTRRGG